MTPAQGSCALRARSSACRCHSPCQVSVIQDVIWRDSSELRGRGRSFGSVYPALPRRSAAAARSVCASRRCVLSQPGRCSGAKGKERPFRGTMHSKMLLFYHQHLPPGGLQLTEASATISTFLQRCRAELSGVPGTQSQCISFIATRSGRCHHQ